MTFSYTIRRSAAALCLLLLFVFSLPISAQRLQQPLGRGVVAVESGSNVFISWRRLAQDPEDCLWNVYAGEAKLNAAPVSSLNLTVSASSVPVGRPVTVAPVVGGVEGAKSAPFARKQYDCRNIFVDILFEEGGSPLRSADFNTSYVWPVDLDGDGEMDFVVNRKSNTDALDSYVEGYLRTGRHLWTVKLGPNELSCAGQDDQICAADLDCDGYGDVIIQSSDGTQFWNPDTKSFGLYVNGSATADTDGDGIINYETQSVRNAPRYISVIDGRTGREKASIEQSYNQHYNRTNRSSLMGDEYNKHVGHMGVFFHDGIHPAVVMEWHMRGTGGDHHYYNLGVAYEFSGGSAGNLKELFNAPTGGPAFHQIRVGDVNGDGCDEMIVGSYTMNNDGSTLFSANIVHGDRFRTSDIDPDRPGMETFAIQQYAGDMLGQILYDAATGEPIKKWYLPAVADIGRGECMDIDEKHRGWEMWSTMDGNVYDAKGELISGLANHYPCEGIWWDGDLGRENVNTSDSHYNVFVEDFSAGRLIEIAKLSNWRYVTVYAKRAAFWGDIIGDWREELILLHKEDGVCAGIIGFTTDIPTSVSNIYCLLNDPHYRGDCTTKGYYQSPNPAFYLGYGMPRPQLPPVMVTDRVLSGAQWSAGSTAFTDFRRAAASYADGQSVLIDLYSPSSVTLSGTLAPSRLYAMPVKGQTVTLGGTGSLTGQMALWKSQAGTLALNAPASFTGQTVISEGTLEVNTDLSSSPVSLRARGTLSGSGKVGALSFEDALNHEGCRLQPKGKLTVTRPLTIDRKVYLELDSPDDLLEVQGDLNLTATLFVNITGSFVTGEAARYHLIHYTGEYAGEGSVTMIGLTGLSYDVVVEDGYVDLIVNEQRQPAEGVTWSGAESALWDYQADNWTLEGNPTGFVAGDGVIFNNEAQRTAVTLSDLMPTASVSVRGTKNFTLGGEGGISGSSSLTMDGTGTLTLNATKSDYTGRTFINSGTVVVKSLADAGTPSSLGAAPATPSNIQIGRATLRIDNVNTATNRGMQFTDAATLQIPSGTAALKGQLTGSGSLTKNGAGQLNINHNGNSYTGGTFLAAGTLAMGTWDARFGASGSALTVTGNATLVVFDTNSSSTIPNLNHPIEIQSGKTLTIRGGQRCMVSGSLKGSGTLKISYPYVRGDFSADMKDFQGTLEVTSGQFRITRATDMSQTKWQLDAGVTAVHTSPNSATEQNYTTKVGALQSTASDASLSTGTWNVGYLGTDATYAGSFSSTATLCKYGEGSLTLTGSGAGALRIYGGSVLANNASAPVTTATTTVHSGGTLSGTGQVAAVTVNAGGTLSAGSGTTVGALRLTGRTTVASGAVLAVRCRKMSATATPSCDHWEQDAAVSLTNPLIRITKTGRGDLAAGDELQLFTGSGTVTVSGTPTIEVTGSTDVFTWDTSRLASEGVIVLTDRTTGVGNLKAREEGALPDGKFLEDGHIVIRKDGKRYTVGGNRK